MPLVMKFANSVRFVLPTITAPAARSLATTVESRAGTEFWSATLPAVVGSPATSRLSLTRTGMPCIGPRTLPVARSRSSSEASVSALGLVVRTAFRPGPRALTAAIRSMYARVSCTLVSCPAAICVCSSATVARSRSGTAADAAGAPASNRPVTRQARRPTLISNSLPFGRRRLNSATRALSITRVCRSLSARWG